MKLANLPFNDRYVNLLATFTLILLFNSNSLFSQNFSNNEPKIEGRIVLDSIWKPKLYLSHISDFSKMYTMSRSMIIAESDVDSSGYFKFNIDYLPKNDNLYRLHISKKGASDASIIIGGKEENHFFIVANKASKIEIFNNNKTFSDVTFKSDVKNKIIDKVDDIVKLIDSTNYSATRVKSEFVTNAFNEQLRKIADTCSYPLVSLYALQKSKYEVDIDNNTGYYQNFIEKWKNEDSEYFKTFKSKVPKRKNAFDSRILIALSILLSFGLGFFINGKIRKRPHKQTLALKTLSVQERKIYALLKAGKSNKEISDDLNIGISTVKSHVSSIYQKLNVKSRKEIINFKD